MRPRPNFLASTSSTIKKAVLWNQIVCQFVMALACTATNLFKVHVKIVYTTTSMSPYIRVGHPSPEPSPRVEKPCRSKQRYPKSAHPVETSHLPDSIPEELNFSQGGGRGHGLQETNTPSDDPMHAYNTTTPVHLRSLATVQSDSYRQRSQSHSGTDDSPRIASHRKSCK